MVGSGYCWYTGRQPGALLFEGSPSILNLVWIGADANGNSASSSAQLPDQVVSKMVKTIRTGKVLVDWSQNDAHKTTVGVYSLRAKERPTVSTPVMWREIEKCLAKRDPALLAFDSDAVLAVAPCTPRFEADPVAVLGRVEAHGDLFEEVRTRKQSLPRPGAAGLREQEAPR